MSEIMNRMKGESPIFFKKLIKWMIGVGATGATIVGIPAMVPQIVLPAAIITIGYHMIVIGLVGSGIAKLTVADTSVLNPPPANDKEPSI